MDALSKKINRLFAQEAWIKAQDVLLAALTKKPEDHWLLTRLSTTYYEQKNYAKALQFVRQAQRIAPHCPLVLWDLAGTLEMLGQDKEALKIYRQLFKRDAEALGEDECGEGVAWANSLLTDCLFRLAGCYRQLGDKKHAVFCLRKYLDLRALGIRGIYKLKDAKKQLIELTKDPGFLDRELGAVKKELLAV